MLLALNANCYHYSYIFLMKFSFAFALCVYSVLVMSDVPADYRVSLQIPQMDVADYKRPYGALWLAHTDNSPIVVLRLWRDEERWLKDLKFFWRKVLRSGAKTDAVTRATRGPGQRVVNWDGTDASGNPLVAGEYKLCAEVAREHGGHTAKCIRFYHPLTKPLVELALDGEFTHLALQVEQ